jgi:hypothetical protein
METQTAVQLLMIADLVEAGNLPPQGSFKNSEACAKWFRYLAKAAMKKEMKSNAMQIL